jgi:hypothetical protein
MLDCRSLFRRRRMRAIRERGVEALMRIGGPAAESALAEASRNGDRMLRRIVAEKWAPAQAAAS